MACTAFTAKHSWAKATYLEGVEAQERRRVELLLVWKKAGELFQQHGDSAWLIAATEADEALNKGLFRDVYHWRRVYVAIRHLQRISADYEAV